MDIGPSCKQLNTKRERSHPFSQVHKASTTAVHPEIWHHGMVFIEYFLRKEIQFAVQELSVTKKQFQIEHT